MIDSYPGQKMEQCLHSKRKAALCVGMRLHSPNSSFLFVMQTDTPDRLLVLLCPGCCGGRIICCCTIARVLLGETKHSRGSADNHVREGVDQAVEVCGQVRKVRSV